MNTPQKIYDLERRLVEAEAAPETDVYKKIDLLNDLAWLLSDIDLKQAQTLSARAYDLASVPKNGQPLHQTGLAYSLRTQGYVNMRLGRHTRGLSQLFEALEIFESLHLDAGVTDVLDHIAGIHYQIGDFPEALNYMYKQLEAAQRVGDKRLIANAYNNLANIYFETGDYEQALETLHNNLRTAIDIGYTRIECLSYLNLAETHQLAGSYVEALKNGMQALRASRAAGFKLFEVYALDFAGTAYLKLGEAEQAIDHLEQALALSRKIESKVTEALILLNLGQAYRHSQQLDLALIYARESIITAQAIEAKSELFKGHLLLSQIYEQQGDLGQALHHFKQHHTFKEMVFGEQADTRLKVLRVARDTETARQEAEIYRLRYVDLKREIAERQRREERLRLLGAVVENTSDGVLVTGADRLDPPGPRMVYVNRALATMTGYAKEELIGQNPRLFQGPKTDRAALDRVREALEQKRPVTVELINYTKAGREFWIELAISPVVDEDGQLTHFVAIQRDITSRKHIEAQLRTINDRLEQQVQLHTADLSETIELLQQEIKERERAEAELQRVLASLERRMVARTEELATFFDLTVLAGQAAQLDQVFEQILPRILEVTRSRVICIHLLDAARSGLRLAAQQNLPDQDREPLQTVDLSPAFQGWLQRPNDPLMTIALSQLAALPSVFRLAGYQTYLGAQIRVGNRVEGLLSCYRFTDRGYGLDEIALVTALAEQLGMMLETHQLRQNVEEMAVLEERQRLARDLHDSVTQSLYSLSLFSRAGREAAEDGDTARLSYSLAELERNTLHALREMRLLLYELRPADLEQEGLRRAVELRLETVERRVGLQLDVRLDHLPDIEPTCEVELYHIIVEALNNVVKHAAADRLTLYLTLAERQLQLRIADDGRGFDPAQTTGGLGLRNIWERTARLNGRLSVFSGPGQGTRLEVVIPYPLEVE